MIGRKLLPTKKLICLAASDATPMFSCPTLINVKISICYLSKEQKVESAHCLLSHSACWLQLPYLLQQNLLPNLPHLHRLPLSTAQVGVASSCDFIQAFKRENPSLHSIYSCQYSTICNTYFSIRYTSKLIYILSLIPLSYVSYDTITIFYNI